MLISAATIIAEAKYQRAPSIELKHSRRKSSSTFHKIILKEEVEEASEDTSEEDNIVIRIVE